jgi:GT2 family glycosyltransferase
VNLMKRPKVVVLGMMSKMPVGGVVWQTLHYVMGLERLGFDTYYVEAHARSPGMLMEGDDEDGSAAAATFIESVMRCHGKGDRWAFHALHSDGRCYGLSERELRDVYRDAALLINMHGGTEPLPEHSATDRLIYLETDPVELQIELLHHRRQTIDFLAPHVAFFTFAENLGSPDCTLPVSDEFEFHPTRQPVILDFWEGSASAGELFTTVGNWRQPWREVTFGNEVYRWSKHLEFEKFLDVPAMTSQAFELALSGCAEGDRRRLEARGWAVRPALAFSRDADAYRSYILQSRAEFTVAKDQNVRFRTGWFSDRSATYLAAGKPVITQETGFGNSLPCGRGLFPFLTMDDIVRAVESINVDYRRHSLAAVALAREYFSHDVVLPVMLKKLGLPGKPRPISPGEARPQDQGESFPPHMVLTPISRWPTRLAAETVRMAMAGCGVSRSRRSPNSDGVNPRGTSIVITTLENLVFTKLCLESVLASAEDEDFEVIVVDNGSRHGTEEYLRSLARRDGRVRPVFNEENLGFAAANNQGLALATGNTIVLLNNDTIVSHGWVRRLRRHLGNPEIGLVGAVTNRAGNEAQIEIPYRTYGDMVTFARGMAVWHAGETRDIRTATMFCVAMRRDVWQEIGRLDERFELGMFEDDDYSVRIRAAGYRVVCAEDCFVHHFGQATIGKLASTGEYGRLFHANRRRFEEKWGLVWEPHRRREPSTYRTQVARVQDLVARTIPPDTIVLVISKGDDSLMELGERRGWHFPQTADGVYAGYHPSDGAEAIAHLEALRASGAGFLVVPEPSSWWLEYYVDFQRHLEDRCQLLAAEEGAGRVYALSQAGTSFHSGAGVRISAGRGSG